MSLSEVRKRPGMYIGDTNDGTGLHNMIYEVVYNSVCEALSGFADRIEVILHPDGSCTVRDNGRGIPTDLHPVEGISAAEIIMTQLHAGGKFWKDDYEFPEELQGVGVSVVNALSETLLLRIWRDGLEHEIQFRRGEPEARLKVVGSSGVSGDGPKCGTEITFTPIRDIFADANFDYARIERRLGELAAHRVGATITLKDERHGQLKEAVYHV